MFLQPYLTEVYTLRRYLTAILILFFSAYSIYWLCSDVVVMQLVWNENGVVELSTAFFFVLASVFFFLTFRANINVFLLLLALLMFVAAGEELSWGQHLLHFSTPDSLNKVNVQHEFNFHNIEMFNGVYKGGIKKQWYQRLLDINILFRLFCVVYGILLPLYYWHIRRAPKVSARWQMPVMPVSMGIFFLLSWAVFYCIKYYWLPAGKSRDYYLTPAEVYEMQSAFIFFSTAVYFYRHRHITGFLGKDVKQYLQEKQG
jgi:hypothetical protein